MSLIKFSRLDNSDYPMLNFLNNCAIIVNYDFWSHVFDHCGLNTGVVILYTSKVEVLEISWTAGDYLKIEISIYTESETNCWLPQVQHC